MEVEPAALAQLAAQADLDLVAALDVGVHRLGEDAEAVAAGRLGAVHGDVGLAQQLGGLGDLLGGEHRADRDADPRLAVADDERLADDRDDPLAQAADVGLALGADLDDGEFVAADAGDRVGLAQQRAQPLADLRTSLSPALWPSVSLTCLKRSRSSMSRATCSPERR